MAYHVTWELEELCVSSYLEEEEGGTVNCEVSE